MKKCYLCHLSPWANAQFALVVAPALKTIISSIRKVKRNARKKYLLRKMKTKYERQSSSLRSTKMGNTKTQWRSLRKDKLVFLLDLIDSAKEMNSNE